jgi:tetratricopeptide (TPR) repeat protein
MFGMLYGALLSGGANTSGGITSAEAELNFVILGLGILTGVPWAVSYAFLILDTAGVVVDTIYGLNSNLLDKANLKAAHEHLKKGEREEAITELDHLRVKYPEAHSSLFLLAILAEEDGRLDLAVDHYREIIQKKPDDQVIWTNAARSLADLLRNKLNDEAGAKHLESEILKRNPDTKYKYTTTVERGKKKKRNIQVERADINHARRLITRGEFPEAIALMKRYVSENPEDACSHFELISLFERLE